VKGRNGEMTKQQLIKETIREYKKTLDPQSKWYQDDVVSFTTGIKKKTVSELQTTLGNLRSLNNPNSDLSRTVKKETRLLDNAGMFNIKNLSPIHALD